MDSETVHLVTVETSDLEAVPASVSVRVETDLFRADGQQSINDEACGVVHACCRSIQSTQAKEPGFVKSHCGHNGGIGGSLLLKAGLLILPSELRFHGVLVGRTSSEPL